MTEEEKKLPKVPVVYSERVFAEAATDVVVSGPTPAGYVHIGFLTERIKYNSQSATLLNPSEPEGAVRLNWQDGDTELTRIFVGQIIITQAALISLHEAITERLMKGGQQQIIMEIFAKAMAEIEGQEKAAKGNGP